jgi:hypothetical protein
MDHVKLEFLIVKKKVLPRALYMTAYRYILPRSYVANQPHERVRGRG